MSCNTAPRRLAEAATRSGISASVTQKSFYFGLAAVGTLLAGLLLSGHIRPRREHPRPSARLTAAPARLAILSGPERVEPIPPHELNGQRCAHCGNSSRPNARPWYRIREQAFCLTCAQSQARQAGISLLPPVAAIPTTINISSFRPQYRPRRTILQPKPITVGPIDNLAGYAVLFRGRRSKDGPKETGLSLTPEIKIEAGGQVRINKACWFVTYDQAGKAIAGPFESVKQAHTMASLLVNLDWTRAVEAFSPEEISTAAQIANEYREELALTKRMNRIPGRR